MYEQINPTRTPYLFHFILLHGCLPAVLMSLGLYSQVPPIGATYKVGYALPAVACATRHGVMNFVLLQYALYLFFDQTFRRHTVITIA